MEKIIVNNVDITKFVTSFEMYEEMDTDTIIGSTISTQIKLKLNNKGGQLTELLDYPFLIGNKTYIIYEKPSKWTQSISLVLYDQMILTNIPYETELPEKTTIEAQLEEMSQLVGIEIDKTALSEDILNRQVDWQDKTMVIRTYIGYIAQCDGKNAYIENDKIVFRVLCEETHDIDFCSNYEINELITITRVYYNNGTVIYSRGNQSNNTLYLDSNNRYVNESDVERIFSLYDHLSFYSFRNFKCRKTQNIKLTNLITYNSMTFMPISIKRKINGGEAKDSLELSGDIQIKNAEDVTVSTNPNEEVKKMIVDQVESTRAEFERVNTDFIKVNQQLETNKADINILNANVAKIEEAYISRAEVEQLYATKAEFGVINSDVANIKTLLSGSTTTGDLQAIVINSKNAIIENGTIKNAMIESLAFDKITGVDINTTKMTVHSNDGMSIWKDNTISIKDSTRTRVQIGKDASGDYNVYIWDKAGKLMFDATGVTANGIQRPIIRDDMVSDTANINGKKINIQSVVKEINNSTEKIKSSTVLYDPTGQTLNVAFNEVVTSIDDIDSRVEANTTQISVANGEIGTLITKTTQQGTDINNLQSSYSSLNQSISGLSATVGSHTSQITSIGNTANSALNAINGLEIGGRNYFSNKKAKAFDSNGEYRLDDYQNTGSFTSFYNLTVPMSYFVNKKVKLSFDIISPNGATYVSVYNHNGTPRYKLSHKGLITSIGTSWVHQELDITVTDMGTTGTSESVSNKIEIYCRSKMGCKVRNVKLEIGNKATDWTPAPEDIESSITEVSDKQSSMQLDLDGFKTTVSSTYATKTQLNTVDGKFANYSTTAQMNSAINQSANTITQKVTTVETEVNNLNGKVTNLTTRVTTAESKITDDAIVSIVRKSTSYKNDLNGKVGSNEIISSINQTAESIKISASKIDLSGYVTISNGLQSFKSTIDLSSSSYDVNTYYPVVGTAIPGAGYHTYNVDVQLNSGTKPSWSTHTNGFSCNLAVRVKAYGWGTVQNGIGWIDDESYAFCDKMPAKFYQMTNSSLPVIFLRGGGRYFIKTDYSSSWSIKTSAFTSNSQTVQPCSTPPTYNQLTKWSYDTDTTYINGGKIYTRTITADKLSVSSLSAISANIGNVTAGTITGVTITGGSITSNTTINVTTDLKVGNNIYLNQSVDTAKKIIFASGNEIWNIYTNSINYISVRSNYRTSLTSDTGAYVAATGSKYGRSDVQVYAPEAVNITANSSYVTIQSNNGGIGFYSNGHMFYFEGANGSNALALRPQGDDNGTIALGQTWARWGTLFTKYNPNVSSDKRLKDNIQLFDKRYEKFFMNLKGVRYVLKSEPDKGYHCGFIAQDVEQALIKSGLTNNDFNGLSKNYNKNKGYEEYSLAYGEFVSLNAHMTKKTILRVDKHDKEIQSLKDENAQLRQELKNTQDKLDAFINGDFQLREVYT